MKFSKWKARLIKTLSLLYAKTEDPVARVRIHSIIEQLRYLKSRDMSTIIYLLHTLMATYGFRELQEFIETAPVGDD